MERGLELDGMATPVVGARRGVGRSGPSRLRPRRPGTPTAVAAAAAMVLLPGVSRFGQYARPYALTMLACVLAVTFWWAYVRSGATRCALGFGASVALAGLAHVYALLMIAVLVLTVVIAPLVDRRRDVIRTVVPAGVAVATITPFLIAVAHARGAPHPPGISVPNVAYVLSSLITARSSHGRQPCAS